MAVAKSCNVGLAWAGNVMVLDPLPPVVFVMAIDVSCPAEYTITGRRLIEASLNGLCTRILSVPESPKMFRVSTNTPSAPTNIPW